MYSAEKLSYMWQQTKDKHNKGLHLKHWNCSGVAAQTRLTRSLEHCGFTVNIILVVHNDFPAPVEFNSHSVCFVFFSPLQTGMALKNQNAWRTFRTSSSPALKIMSQAAARKCCGPTTCPNFSGCCLISELCALRACSVSFTLN